MHGQGKFSDPRLGINVVQSPDLVTSKLPALRAYQLSLEKPAPPSGSFDAAAAERGWLMFNGAGRCSTCHVGTMFTDVNFGRLHDPSETGMDPRYAARTSQKRYRTTPRRGLWQHPPYSTMAALPRSRRSWTTTTVCGTSGSRLNKSVTWWNTSRRCEELIRWAITARSSQDRT